MLRAIRFATVLEFTLDPSVEAAIRNQSSRLQPPTVSMERIRDEFSKLLLAEKVQAASTLLDATGPVRILRSWSGQGMQHLLGQQELRELVADAFHRDRGRLQPTRLITDGRLDGWIEGELEDGGEANRAQHAKRVFVEGRLRSSGVTIRRAFKSSSPRPVRSSTVPSQSISKY